MIKVILGHAYANENGKATGGQPGDQTGRELRKQEYYVSDRGDWENVFRANDSKDAKVIAETCTEAVDNQNIGYAQDNRLSLYDAAVKKKFKVSKIKTKCDCDCSSLVAVCINAAGIEVDPGMCTADEKKIIERTKKFKTLPGMTKPEKLQVGDILHRVGHTAIVIAIEGVDEKKTDSVKETKPAKDDKKSSKEEKKPVKKTYLRVQVVAANNLTTAEYYVKILKDRLNISGTITAGRSTKYIVYTGDYATKKEADTIAKLCNYASIPTYTYNVTY